MTRADPQRRIDLDWIRILAFGSLILYHVGMYCVTWDWQVSALVYGAMTELRKAAPTPRL